AKVPKKSSAVAVVAATQSYPAQRAGGLWKTSFQPKTEGGPLNLSVRFTGGKQRHSAPGGVVFLKPKSTRPQKPGQFVCRSGSRGAQASRKVGTPQGKGAG